MSDTPSLVERFQGGLLGLLAGDALGAHFEGFEAADVRDDYHSWDALVASPPPAPWRYTDDTEMAIGVAEALVADGTIRAETLCRAWGNNYTRGRNYGATRLVLEAIRRGDDPGAVAASLFLGGSYGNGAAMRVAPVGLFFHDHPDRLWEEAARSAEPTHPHPLAIEGAQLLALAVARAITAPTEPPAALFAELRRRCRTAEFLRKLDEAGELAAPAEIARLGHGAAAINSVVTAIACAVVSSASARSHTSPTRKRGFPRDDPATRAGFPFLDDGRSWPPSLARRAGVEHDDIVPPTAWTEYEQVVATAIYLGGDTDTIAAMAGAIAGARLGMDGLPPWLLEPIEDGPKGRTYVGELAVRLFDKRVI